MLDVAAYLERVGLARPDTPAAIHRAHATSIPFENLDPHRGVTPSLNLVALERKLVHERRGGYCFEQNLLLAGAMESLGLQVEPILARVRLGGPAETVRPLTHLLLRVTVDDAAWHADVGFGAHTLLEPIPFGPGDVHEQSGWRYRIVSDGDELVLQTEIDGAWQDLYSFLPRPVPQVDIELGNWFTGAHPSSGFVTGLIVAARDADGTRRALSDWGGLGLTRTTPVHREHAPVTWPEVPRLLAEDFGLPGFTLGDDNRLVAA